MKIAVNIPLDRHRLASITVYSDEGALILGPYPCLALADSKFAEEHGNPTRDSSKRGGDFPVGVYACTAELLTEPLTAEFKHSYGDYGFLRLEPISGMALIAKENGRQGLLMHPGPINPAYTYWRGLRPTHGCLRLLDADSKEIVDAVRASTNPVTLEAQLLLPGES